MKFCKILEDLLVEEETSKRIINQLAVQKINSYIKIILNRFKEIGYKVPNITCLIKNNYIEQKGDFYPLFTNENENVIYVDIDAYEDLARNKSALMFYLPHEIAHIISNEGHNGNNFKKCINDWNKIYSEKILADPENEDIYNKKFLPTYFKKSSWYDKQKDAKVADEGMKKEIWKQSTINEEKKVNKYKQSYFPY